MKIRDLNWYKISQEVSSVDEYHNGKYICSYDKGIYIGDKYGNVEINKNTDFSKVYEILLLDDDYSLNLQLDLKIKLGAQEVRFKSEGKEVSLIFYKHEVFNDFI